MPPMTLRASQGEPSISPEPICMFRKLWQGSVWDGIGWEARGKPNGSRRAQGSAGEPKSSLLVCFEKCGRGQSDEPYVPGP